MKETAMKNKLKEARFFGGMPQVKLAQISGIHYSTISRIECGYLAPTQVQRGKLAKALGVAEEWLFPNSD